MPYMICKLEGPVEVPVPATASRMNPEYSIASQWKPRPYSDRSMNAERQYVAERGVKQNQFPRPRVFMLRSLYRLGFDWEAIEYFGFILDAVSGGDLNRPFQLQIMYGIGGERDLTEKTLDNLSGYRGARPVRIGNSAWNQHQHDVWGMILVALDIQFRREPARS